LFGPIRSRGYKIAVTFGRVLRSLRERGVVGTAGLVAKNIMWQLRRWDDSRFDRRHGTDTCGRTDLDRLAIDSANKDHGVYYEATPERTFRKMMRSLPRPLDGYTFVDYGSGKGRVLLFAAPYGFRRIVGVEFSPELCEAARSNLAAFVRSTGRSWPVEIACTDAASFEVPDGPVVLYFYNPFDRALMGRIAAQIEKSWTLSPRGMFVVYYNTQSADAFESLGFLVRRATGTSRLDFATAVKRPYAIYEATGRSR
jgi:SAM-dependent methyltransferase